MKYYDENRNGYYNPDDGQDSRLPGENANWKAIQAGFAASAARDSQQDTDVASVANVAEAARRTADQALEAAQAAGGDITDLEAAVATARSLAESAGTAAQSAASAAQAAQQTADGAATAAQAAQTTADGAASDASAAQTTANGAASDAASARNMASDAFQAATQANQTAGNAANGVSALLPRVAALEAEVSEPTAIYVMGSGMTMEYPQVIKPNRIVHITTSGGTVSPLGDYTVPDGIYHVIPDSNVTVFPPESIGGAPTNVFGINGREMPIFGSPYDQTRFGITITGGVISGRVYFDVQSSDLAADVTLAQASLVQVLLYLIPARYAEVSGS